MADTDLFSSMIFWGVEHLPRDLPLGLDLGELRAWAGQSGYLSDPDSQLLLASTVEALARVFSRDDKLGVCVQLAPCGDGALDYAELPFVPVAALMAHDLSADVVGITFRAGRWDQDGRATGFGEVRFVFRLQGIDADLASTTTGKATIPKFVEMFQDFDPTPPTVPFTQRVGERDMEGGFEVLYLPRRVEARFFKSGRLHDVAFTIASEPRDSELAALLARQRSP